MREIEPPRPNFAVENLASFRNVKIVAGWDGWYMQPVGPPPKEQTPFRAWRKRKDSPYRQLTFRRISAIGAMGYVTPGDPPVARCLVTR